MNFINPNPALRKKNIEEEVPKLEDDELQNLRDLIYDIIRTIKDPEHPYNLEELDVVQEANVFVNKDSYHQYAEVLFNPTVPHCSLATMIGLCIRKKVLKELPKLKLTVRIKKGFHETEDEINKQVNDKERVTAALENRVLQDKVNDLIKEEEITYE